MVDSLILELLRQFGAPGAMLAFMVWDRIGQNKLSKERTEADVDMARALTLLSAKLDGIHHVR